MTRFSQSVAVEVVGLDRRVRDALVVGSRMVRIAPVRAGWPFDHELVARAGHLAEDPDDDVTKTVLSGLLLTMA